MKKEIVRASGTSTETLWLLVVVLLVVVVSGTVIMHRTRREAAEELLDYQVSAFRQFNGSEQGTYNDLFTAAEDIDAMHVDSGNSTWPSVQEMRDQYIPPFVRDQAWKSRGGLQWIRKAAKATVEGKEVEHVCAYFGRPLEEDISGAFLLVMSHHHAAEGDQIMVDSDHEDEDAFKIWYHSGNDVTPPRGFTKHNLIVKGWREVVPYSGAEELRRLKGERS